MDEPERQDPGLAEEGGGHAVMVCGGHVLEGNGVSWKVTVFDEKQCRCSFYLWLPWESNSCVK